MNTLFEAELEVSRRNHLNKLVQSGVFTQDQADVAFRPRTQAPARKSIGELTSQLPDETPSYQERAAALNRSIDERYRRTYGEKSPSLGDTLSAYSQNEAFSPAERKNFAETISKVTAEHEASFRSLSGDGQQNVVNRIGKNYTPDLALGNIWGGQLAGIGYEVADMGNRWRSWTQSGYGLPGMKQHYNQTADKYGHVVAPFAMFGGIIVDSGVGFVTAIRDIAQGDAMLEDFLHFGSMVALPFTFGASGVAAAGKATQAAMSVSQAQRFGRVWATLNKMPSWMKKSTKHPTGTWGGLNVAKWGKMGPITKVSTAAELAEIATNPEELWYEIFADVGMQGSMRMIQGMNEGVREHFTSPEKQMEALEKGIQKRIRRTAAVDQSMSDFLQEQYDEIKSLHGSEVSDEQIAMLDGIIQTANAIEDGLVDEMIKSDPKLQGMSKRDVATDLVARNYMAQAEAIVAQQKEAAQTNEEQQEEAQSQGTVEGQPVSAEPAPQAGGTETDQESVQEQAVPADDGGVPGTGEVEAETVFPQDNIGDAPQTSGDIQQVVGDTDTGTGDQRREIDKVSDAFSGVSVKDMDLGEIEGVDENAIVQDTDEKNAFVIREVDAKAEKVWVAADNYIQALDAQANAEQASEANPEDENLQIVAADASKLAQESFDNWMNTINAKIGNEPEGEESTNEDYIADDTARAKKYADIGRGFLQVAADPGYNERRRITDGDESQSAVSQIEDGARASTAQTAIDMLNQQTPTTTAPTETEVPPVPAPDIVETESQEPQAQPETQPESQPELEIQGESNETGTDDTSDAAVAPDGGDGTVDTGDGEGTGEVVGDTSRTDAEGNESVIQTDSDDATPSAEQNLQNILDQIEVEDTPESEIKLDAPQSGVVKDDTQKILDGLRTGAFTAESITPVGERLQTKIAELQQKQSLSDEEFKSLSDAYKQAAHLKDAMAIWKNRNSKLRDADIIDGVLYFKSDPSVGKNKMFSNFFMMPMKFGKNTYLSVEHYFQSMKFEGTGLKTNITDRNGRKQSIPVSEAIKLAATPYDAWKLANDNFNRLSPENRAKWESRRGEVMMTALKKKLADPTVYKFGDEAKTFAQYLADTGDTDLVHLENISTERKGITNAPPYWGAYLTPNAKRTITDEDGTEREVPAAYHGANQLGVMLMQLRGQLGDVIALPEPRQDSKLLAVETLPLKIQQGLQSQNINNEFLYVTPGTEEIIKRIVNGEMVLSIGGGRRDKSSTKGYYDANRDWINFSEEHMATVKKDLAVQKGWMAEADEITPEVESRVDTYNDTQAEAAAAAKAVGDASIGTQGVTDDGKPDGNFANKAIIMTGGAFGTDVEAIRGAVGANWDAEGKGGTAIAVMPTGLKKRPNPIKEGSPLEYTPNVPEIDLHEHRKIGAISLVPEDYDGNERYSASGTTSHITRLKQRNGAVAAFSDVLFITHANDTDGTPDTIRKALDMGRPVVMLDPAMFKHPLPGSEEFVNEPGVYVLSQPEDWSAPGATPLYHPTRVRGKDTKAWQGENLLKRIQVIAKMHNPDASYTAESIANFVNATQNWTENDIKNRIRELHDAAKNVRRPFDRLAIQYEVSLLNKLRASRHPSPSRTSPVDFDYVTQLDPTERQVSGAVIGLHNYQSFQDFHTALAQNGIKVYVDVRQNTYDKGRNEDGEWVADWTDGDALRESFMGTNIVYVRAPQFTPTSGTRSYQQIIDELTSIGKMSRGALDATFTTAYFNFLKETDADMGMFLKDTIAMHVGYNNVAGAGICFGCVEHESQQCHRSMLGEIMRDVLGIQVLDIHSGGMATAFEPHTHQADETTLPVPAYPGTTQIAVNPTNEMYIPQRTSRMQLTGHASSADDVATEVRYKHADHPGYELILRRKPDGTISPSMVSARTQEDSLLSREAQIQYELGAEGITRADGTVVPQRTPFVSEREMMSHYTNKQLSDDGVPAFAEHIFRSVSASIRHPELYANTEEIEHATDNPLIPKYQSSKLKVRVVRATQKTEGFEFGPDLFRAGEYKQSAEDHHVREEDRKVTIRDEGASFGERHQPTEHEVHQYHHQETPDIEARLSPSNKYVSAVVPRGNRIEVPSTFELNLRIQISWENFRSTDQLAAEWGAEPRTEAESLYEFLSINPHLWYAVNEEGRPIDSVPEHGLPDTIASLPANIRSTVYGDMTRENADKDWNLIKNFIARGRQGRNYGTRSNPEEVAAALRFANRAPKPPNILTQVDKYLSAVNKAVKRFDPIVDTAVPLPQYDEHQPRVQQYATYNPDTGMPYGGMDAVSEEGVDTRGIDPEVTGGEGQLNTEGLETDFSVADTENVEATEDEQVDVEGAVSGIQEEVALTTAAAGSAGVPFPTEVGARLTLVDGEVVRIDYLNTGHYAPNWFDTWTDLNTVAENGFDVQWQNGTLRLRKELFEEDASGKWNPTGEYRKVGFDALMETVDDVLYEVFNSHNAQANAEGATTPTQHYLQGLRGRVRSYFKDTDFEVLSLWQDQFELDIALNLLKEARTAIEKYGGTNTVSTFELKGYLLTSIPYGGETADGYPRRQDMIMTNTGLLVPLKHANRYVVDPVRKQVYQRPDTQLNMIVDEMDVMNEDGVPVTTTRFFADKNRHGQAYEVLNENENELEVSIVGTQETIRFSKQEEGVVVRENRAVRSKHEPIHIMRWQNLPINTTDETKRALGPIAMAMRDGFLKNTGNVPLHLYAIDLAREGTWSYRLKGSHEFNVGDEGRDFVDVRFTVEVVPTEQGFMYKVGAWAGVGATAEPMGIFNVDGVPSDNVEIEMSHNGQKRAPHEAILQSLWHQRDAAIREGWQLPHNPDSPVTRELDFENTPKIDDWTTADEAGGNPNDIYFESWERWSEQIEPDVVVAIEKAIFQAPYPIHNRVQVMVELDGLGVDDTISELITPGLLRQHLEAQNVWEPTDTDFIELNSRSPVVHSYGHKQNQDYSISILEGSGIAEVKYLGESIGQIDFSEFSSMWEQVDNHFGIVVREHAAQRRVSKEFNVRMLSGGDVVWEAKTYRVRFSASSASVYGELKTDEGWSPQEETQHQLEYPYTISPAHKQLAYVERIEGQLETAKEQQIIGGLVDTEELENRIGTPPIETEAEYTGVVEELQADIDDHSIYQDGDMVPQVRRFQIGDSNVELHLLMPDMMHATDELKPPMPKKPDEVTPSNLGDQEYWDTSERRENFGDVWRRAVFFNRDTGQYVRHDPSTQEWVPDSHTFGGLPVAAFQPKQIMETLPEYEYPSDPQAEDISESDTTSVREYSEGFPSLRREAQEESDAYRQSQIWVRIAGASDSLIRQKVEDIYANPAGWVEGDTTAVSIDTSSAPQGLSESQADIRNEIESQEREFVEKINVYKKLERHGGSQFPAQTTIGMRPNGLMVSVPDTNTSIQSVGFENGERFYQTADGWEVVVRQRHTSESYEATATHEASGANITVSGIYESGITESNTQSGHINEDVLAVYQSDGFFNEGEETVLTNSFDNAASFATMFAHKYAQSTQAQSNTELNY